MAKQINIDSGLRHAHRLLDCLVDNGPMTALELCDALGWSRGRLATALRMAREDICPTLGISIPTPTPEDGWLYCATTEWEPVQAGASHSLGHVETRLRSINRDVNIVIPHLTRGSRDWQRATFLRKHLVHILGVLDEIDSRELPNGKG